MPTKPLVPENKLQEWVDKVDTGGRDLGQPETFLISFVAFTWSLFQLYYASPLPFLLSDWSGLNLTINSTEARCIHLAFAFLVGYMAYTNFDDRRSITLWIWWVGVIGVSLYSLSLSFDWLVSEGAPHPWYAIILSFVPLLMVYGIVKRHCQSTIPWYDYIIAIVGVFCALYPFLFQNTILARIGLPTPLDLIIFIVGMVILLEMTRRAIGFPLACIAILFMAYSILGPNLPDLIAHKGASLAKLATHQWLTTEGVFGIALDVSTRYVFLFVLFGALLEKAGAGQYFIHLAFSLVGRFRGGPAKAAVLSSALTGAISGSSIANVATTGTFTIPLMKKSGFKPERAGAVEVASSVNGQLMPPIMGAAAFLMTDYIGIPYTDIIKHALLPALLSYISLLYIVHLEAVKAGIQPIKQKAQRPLKLRLLRVGIVLSSTIIVLNVLIFIIDWLGQIFPHWAGWVLGLSMTGVYGISLFLAAKSHTKEQEDLTHLKTLERNEFAGTFAQGFYYFIPIFILLWCLIYERLSPTLSVFWAVISLLLIMATHHLFLQAIGLKKRHYLYHFVSGLHEIREGLILGARSMVGIAVATAAAGVIVGTVSLTGIGFMMTELVAYISGGNVLIVLTLTAILCLILGMGLPTTPNYIIVSSLMAPVIVSLMGQAEFAVPLVAAHLFVFYFGVMADVTPPVGLASFAASAIAGSTPIKTGVVATVFSFRTAILPFIFIFNSELLLINIDNFWSGFVVITSSTIAILLFAAATQGYFLVRNKWYETVLMLLICFTLFRPDYWMQLVQPLYQRVSMTQTERISGYLEHHKRLRLIIEVDQGDKVVNKVVMVYLGDSNDDLKEVDLKKRLQKAGIIFGFGTDDWTIQAVKFGSPAQKAGLTGQTRIKAIEIPNPDNPKELFYLLALALLGGVIFLQHRRKRSSSTHPVSKVSHGDELDGKPIRML